MDQRRVRLGDVLDDYCPRERRVTNHAVVALVGNDIKLTRCTTCDTEHAYKAARVPPRRQTRLVAALSNAGADRTLIAAPGAAAETKPAAAAPPVDVPPPAPSSPPPPPHVDSVHRPLIRATLGRTDPAASTRAAPVFTIREHAGRDGNVDRSRQPRKRRNGGRPDAEPNGNRAESHPGQFARSGYGKNPSNSGRNRNGNGNGRGERFGKNGFRSRGKSRSR